MLPLSTHPLDEQPNTCVQEDHVGVANMKNKGRSAAENKMDANMCAMNEDKIQLAT